MAPEQLGGGEPIPSTDVYALALVAYEALTGMRAREGRTPMEVAHRIATSPPPDLRDVMPEASPAAADVLRQAMARDPAERPGSAGELAERLASALGEPPTVPRPTQPAAAPVAPAPAPAP